MDASNFLRNSWNHHILLEYVHLCLKKRSRPYFPRNYRLFSPPLPQSPPPTVSYFAHRGIIFNERVL